MDETDVFMPASMRQTAFTELVGDAVSFYRLARDTSLAEQAHRFARQSILLSSLTIECAANNLLWASAANPALRADLERLSPLSKMDACLQFLGKSLDRSRVEVQWVKELIAARNDYVHPKVVVLEAEVGFPQDGGEEWLMPLKMPAHFRKGLDIAKQAQFWDAKAAQRVLHCVTAFYKHLIDDVMQMDPRDLQRTFSSFVHLDEKPILAVSGPAGAVLEVRDEGLDYAIYRRMMGRFG